ncbi:MAG: hypothetical protein HYZ14_03985 [Bacteroidetes bacterium]|nr:hypothetical protein [Bacteroidota bacterium]
MAINQFNITLIPRQPIVDKYGSVPTQLFVDHAARQKHFDKDFEAEFDFEDDLTVNWWRHNKIKFTDIEPNVSSMLRPIEWTEKYDDIKSYGDKNDNDISISLADKIYIDEFDCRINVVLLDKNFINLILNLAKQLDCLFIDKQDRLFEPTIENLIDSIKTSNAFKFASNPSDFFDKFSSGQIKPE